MYIGFDKPRSMGRAGFGGTIALPVWVEYMRYALQGVPQKGMPMPAKIVRNGGEYFLQEQQSTSPRLAIDNRGATPDAEDIQAAGGDPVIPEETAVEPVQPQNGGGGAAPSPEIDALF